MGLRKDVEPKKVTAMKVHPNRDRVEHSRSITEMVWSWLEVRSSGVILKFFCRVGDGKEVDNARMPFALVVVKERVRGGIVNRQQFGNE